MKKVMKALGNLAGAIVETGEEALDSAKAHVADGVSSFVEENQTKRPTGEGHYMLKDIKVEDKPVPAVAEGAIVVLEKGANISIAASIAVVGCGIEWDEVKNGPEFDADVAALLVGKDGKAIELIYYGTSKTDGKILDASGAIFHTGDNLTGADDAVEGVAVNEDDETIFAQLADLPDTVEKVVFFVNIYNAAQKGQNFGSTSTMQARLYDVDSGDVFMTADLMEDNATSTSMIVGEFYRKDGSWKYKNMAQGGNDTVQQFVNKYK